VGSFTLRQFGPAVLANHVAFVREVLAMYCDIQTEQCATKWKDLNRTAGGTNSNNWTLNSEVNIEHC
jgi:hypothetical protein